MRPSFYQLTLPELQKIFLENNLPVSGPGLLFNWHYKKRKAEPCTKDLAKKSISYVKENFDFTLPVIDHVHESQDKTVKFLFTHDVLKRAPFKAQNLEIKGPTDAEFAALLKSSEKIRKPANSLNLSASKMSNELNALQKEFHGLKTSEEVENFFNKLDKGYEGYPDDVKFYITQILPTKAYRGIFYRLNTLFDGKSGVAHSQAISTAKYLAKDTSVYLPFEYSEAIFQYVSSPYYKGSSVVTGFKTEADMQVWMVEELLPLINKSITRLNALDLVNPVMWDQKFVNGPESFQDDINRFKLVGEFEKNLALSSMYGSVASLASTRAYSIEKSIDLFKEVGQLFGLDGFGPFRPTEGVDYEKVTRVLRRDHFKSFGTLLPDGKIWMDYSYRMTLKSMQRLTDAWDLSASERKAEDFYAINTNFLNVERAEFEENLNIAKRVMFSKQAETLRSSITGEVVSMDFAKLYKEPIADLKDLLPTTFEKGSKKSRVVTLADGTQKKLTYRNYAEGSPKDWNVSAYKPYFPSVETSDDMRLAVRVFTSMQGNWLSVR